MSTPNLHRKLIQYPTNSTVPFPFCAIQCDPQLNPTGLCSPDCINYCRTFCPTAGSSPSPSPATSPFLPSSPSNHHHHHHKQLSLPLKISLIFLFATFIYTLYKFYTVWFRSTRHRTPPSPSPENQELHDHEAVDHPIWHIRTTGLRPSLINAIRVVKFDKTDCVIEGTDCSVCLTEFEIDDMLRLLPNCKHAFHVSCIDTWLRSHINCPLCRAGIEDKTADLRSPEQGGGGVEAGVHGESDVRVLIVSDGDEGEASGSSVLRIGETDDQDENVSKRETLELESMFFKD